LWVGVGGALFAGAWPAEIQKEFPPAEKCKRCHESHYAEWRKSRHSQSLTSPTFQQYYRIYLESETGKKNAAVKDADDCLFCHAPALFAFPGALDDLRAAVIAGKPPIEGVTCSVCHKISEVNHIKPIRKRITIQKGQTFFGPLKDPEESDAHDSAFQALRETSDLCGACHGKFENPLACADNYDTYERGWAPTQGVECQNCHMGRKDGAAAVDGPKRTIHNHWFPGAYYQEHLQKAFHLGGKWKKDGTLYVTLDNRPDPVRSAKRMPSGHNSPAGCAPGTGLLLRVRFFNGDSEVATSERWLGVIRDGDFWEAYEKGDSTLKPGELREFFFEPPADPITRAVVTASYTYFRDSKERVKNEPPPALIQEITIPK
jgi:hypothetical protein